MVWVRIDDGFPEHSKALEAGDEACWLFVSGLCFCARNLTDGFIPDAKVSRLTGLRRVAQHVQRLVDAGLWEPVDGGYRVHDYDDYQPTKARVTERRRNTAERVAKHRGNSVTNGGEPLPPHAGTGVRASGSSSTPPAEPSRKDSKQKDARARFAVVHPQLSDVLDVLNELAGMLTEPAAVASALQAYPAKDAVSAAHRVASIVNGGQNRTTHTNALLMAVLRDMPDQAAADEREQWDDALGRAMKGAV